MLEDTSEDTFKAVSSVETGYYATEDSNKTVQNAEHYDKFQRTDSNTYKMPFQPPYRRSFEEKVPVETRVNSRRKLYIIGGLVLLVVIILVSVLGGVLSSSNKRKNADQDGSTNADTQRSESLPGSLLLLIHCFCVTDTLQVMIVIQVITR
jgi:hypothetical protein